MARDDLKEFSELKYDSASVGDIGVCALGILLGEARGSSSSQLLTGDLVASVFLKAGMETGLIFVSPNGLSFFALKARILRFAIDYAETVLTVYSKSSTFVTAFI